MVALLLATLDLGEKADGPQRMLVDGVMMIHIELHHRHDAAELVDEAAEHAGFVHRPEHRLGMPLRRQHVEEYAVGLLVVAQIGIDQP